MKKVIDGEPGGISKAFDWKGGGSFTLSRPENTTTFIEQIEEAKDTKALLRIWEQMKAKSFLNYNGTSKNRRTH